MPQPTENGPDKDYAVIVNGRERIFSAGSISYEEVLTLAFNPVPNGSNWVFTVTFRRGRGDKPEGMLTAGTVTKVKKGMVFNVTATDKS